MAPLPRRGWGRCLILVGKTKQWPLRAVGFDLLHQLSNITHNLTAQSFSETWTNTVRSYVSCP